MTNQLPLPLPEPDPPSRYTVWYVTATVAHRVTIDADRVVAGPDAWVGRDSGELWHEGVAQQRPYVRA